MPQLDFLITGDDRELRKKLARLSKDVSKDIGNAGAVLSVEIEKGNKASQKAIDLINQEGKAVKRRNTEESKRRP